MKVNGIENQAYREKTVGAKPKYKNKGGFYENLSENLNGQAGKGADIKTAVGAAANRTAGVAANKAYQYRNIPSAAAISGSRAVSEGVTICEIKNISYQNSDYIKAFVQSGFTLMAQVDVSAGSVYIEQKMEDGTVKGYDVDMSRLDTNANEPIVQTALEAWEMAKAKGEMGESEEAAEDTELSVEEALQRFYEFVEDRIKNGPPKYSIGDSEFSIEEWNQFLKSVDGQLDDIKEETEELVNQLFQDKTRSFNGTTVYAMEAQLTSGIIGFGALEDGTVYSASYDEDSTMGNPIINIRMESKNKGVQTYKVSVNQVDLTNATELELLALCSHVDKMGMSEASNAANSYSTLLYYAKNSAIGNQSARNADEFMSLCRDWSAMVTDAQIDKLDKEGKIDAAVGKSLQHMLEAIEKYNSEREKADVSRTEREEQALLKQREKVNNGVPYNHLAKDGIIEYNGVVFICDEKYKAIRLGDTSNPKNCLNIPLSGGGSLIVNRDNLGDLAKAIGMFSPEDVNLIMRAIAQDAKIQQMKHQIDEETSGIELAEEMEEE